MAINYAKNFNRRATPQSQPIPVSTQVRNSGGGYSWAVDDWTRFDRFLILGTEGGTYYIGERDLVKQNHDALVRCIKADGLRAVNRIVEISDAGRAPKNAPAIFALALAATHGDAAAKAHAFANEKFNWRDVNRFLKQQGVTLISAGLDEVPMAYKNIADVMAAQRDLVTVLGEFMPKLVKMAPAGERAED